MRGADLHRALLLQVLTEQPGHGYEAHKQLAERGLTIGLDRTYRALRAMEAEGLVVSCRAPSSLGPERRDYQVTSAGYAELAVRVAEAESTIEVLDAFVRRAVQVEA